MIYAKNKCVVLLQQKITLCESTKIYIIINIQHKLINLTKKEDGKQNIILILRSPI